MWPFASTPTKASLQGHKTVTIRGSRFIIRRIVPLLDFPMDKIPAIFTDFSKHNYQLDLSNPVILKRLQDDMMLTVRAAVVSPNKEDGVTTEDIFRDPELGYLLYLKIIEHSLLRFRGMKGSFFLVVKTLLRPIIWLKSINKDLAISSSKEKVLA